MGFSLREFLNLNNKEKAQQPAPARTATPTQNNNPFRGITNFASKAYDQVNFADGNRTYKQRTPTTNVGVAQQVGHIVQPVSNVAGKVWSIPYNAGAILNDTARLGVANLTGNQNAASINRSDLAMRAGPVVDPFVSIGKTAGDVVKVTAANLTGNQKAAQNANDALDVNAPKTFLFGPFAKLAENYGTSLGVKNVADNPNFTDEEKDAAIQGVISDQYQNAGLNGIDDKAATRKIVGQSIEGGMNVLLASNALSAAEGAPGATLTTRLAPSVTQGIKLGALNTIPSVLQEEKITPSNVVGDFVSNTAAGAMLPLLSGLGGEALRAAPKGALAVENMNRRVANLPEKPLKILDDNEIGALSDYAAHLNGEKTGHNASELHDLELQARSAAKKVGIDVTSDQRPARVQRIAQELDKQLAYQKSKPTEADILQGGYIKNPFADTPKNVDDFQRLRKNYSSDEEFYDKVILNSQEAPGEIGDFARHIARAVEGRGEKITDVLNDEFTVDNPKVTAAINQSNTRNELAKTVRDLEKSTGQKGLYSKVAEQMKNMTETEQIAYMGKALTDMREKGILAKDWINRQNNVTPKTKAPAAEPLTIEPSFRPKTPAKDTVKLNEQPKIVENSLTKGGKQGRQNISPETQAQVSGEHVIRNTKELGERGQAAVDNLKLDDAINAAHERLAVPAGKIGDEDVSFVTKAIERADAEGRPNDATALHDSLSEHLVASGQTAQAASLLYQRSPQGVLYQAVRDLGKAGVEVTPEMKAKLQVLTDKIKGAINPLEKMRAVAEFHQAVSKIMPQGIGDQLTSIWKAGLLSGTKTQTGNFVSNGTFAALKGLSDVPAAVVDKGLSLITGERTKTATQRGKTSGFFEGVKKGANTLKTGFDERNYDGGKYEQHAELNFKNPVMQKVFGVTSNMVFRGMNAADQPWYYAALKNNLYDLAKADGLNKGLKGSELRAHMEKMVANPTEKMASIAKTAADKATLNYDTIAAKGVQGIHKGIDSYNGGKKGPGKTVAHAAVNVLAPFVRVPTAYLARSLDYTPVGGLKALAKGAYDAAKGGKNFDQRALSQALGEATTGTAVIFLGATLASKGLVSGQQPKDQKEAARWKAEHITPNSIKIGDKWVSLNYLGPAGILIGGGKDYHDAAAVGDSPTMAAIAGAGKNLSGQSFLTGFSGFSNAIQDPQRSAKSFVNSEVGSIIPSWLNDSANFGDKFQRETNTPLDAVKSRVPGARNTLPVKQDVYGNQLLQRSNTGNDTINRLNVLVNPLRPSDTVQGNSTIDEVSRLHNVDPSNKDLQVTPTPIDKVLTFDGVKVSLTNDQRRTLQTNVGQNIQKQWGEVIKTDGYKSLSDEEKAKVLTNIRQDVTEGEKRKYQVDNSLGQYNNNFTGKPSKLSTDATNYVNNTVDYNKYTSPKTETSSDYTVASSNRSLAMTRAKTSNDLQKWGQTATEEYDALEQQKKSLNPKTDQVKINTIIKKQEALKNEAQKYASQGYIKKPAAIKKTTTKSSKYDYAKGLASINTAAFSNATALRNLVKKTRITKRRLA